MIEQCRQHGRYNTNNTPKCPDCFEARYQASDVLHEHINEALVALKAQDLSTEQKVLQVMAILGRAQATTHAGAPKLGDQIVQIKPAPGSVPGHPELIPMAVFQISDAPDGHSEGSRAVRYTPDAPIYFKKQKPGKTGKPVFRQV